MNAPRVGDDVYIVRHLGLAFQVVEVRDNKHYPYVLQHPVTRERMAYSLGELVACPTGEPFRIALDDLIDSGAFKYGRNKRSCEHQWFRSGYNRHRRVEHQRCAVIGCVKKRNVALLDCPACVARHDDTTQRDAHAILESRRTCIICSGDGLIPAPAECRCCGSATKKAMCGPCLAAHGYKSVVHCDRQTADEKSLDELLDELTVARAHPSPEGRRKAEVLS